MIHYIIIVCLGSFYIYTADCFLENRVTKDSTNAAAQTYRVLLSNSGPVIPSSNITFKAHLVDEHGLPLSDEQKYRFTWRSTADGETFKEVLNAKKNSTWKKCFSNFVRPQEYRVSVSVYAKDDIFAKRLAEKSQKFQITETLNGEINVTQPLKHRHIRKDKPPIFSTSKNITLKLNLTDLVLHNSSLLHECDWFIDGDFVGNTTNSTELVADSIKDIGLHSVSAIVKFYEIPDCDTLFERTSNRSGIFNMTVNLKDPIEVVNVKGRSDVLIHHALNLDVYYSGSPPFNACWSLQPVSNQSKVLNQSCWIEWMENEQNFTIYMNKTSLVPGQYVINITITNDVSVVEKRHFITVKNEPLPYYGPASVLIPVVGGLIAVTVVLALTVYVVNKRRNKNVETANFDFHPPTLPLVNSVEHERSFTDKIQQALFKMFGLPSLDGRPRRSNSGLQTSQNVYGSCDGSVRSCA